jgi:hypothetical protein
MKRCVADSSVTHHFHQLGAHGVLAQRLLKAHCQSPRGVAHSMGAITRIKDVCQ